MAEHHQESADNPSSEVGTAVSPTQTNPGAGTTADKAGDVTGAETPPNEPVNATGAVVEPREDEEQEDEDTESVPESPEDKASDRPYTDPNANPGDT